MHTPFRSIFLGFVVIPLLIAFTPAPCQSADTKKLVLIAGEMSHPPLMHEFRAGCLLLQKCLQKIEGLEVEVHDNGWVKDEATFADADAIVIYADGGPRHPALQKDRLQTLGKLIEKGVGFGCMHYGVEVPADRGSHEFMAWIGGHYEHMYSCNPMWEPRFENLPKHQVTRGVKPFAIRDEWYFNMRFLGGIPGNEPHREGDVRFVPILMAKPSDDVRNGPYVYPKGPYEHIIASKGRKEAVLWVVERPDGGRGFGFTGGHFHLNWGDDSFRKIILNTLNWVAKNEVPENGIESEVSKEELHQNLDPKEGK